MKHYKTTVMLTGTFHLGYVKVYILAPPLVYGLASGAFVDARIQNFVPTGVSVVVGIVKSRGSIGRVGLFKNLWSIVEIHDRTCALQPLDIPCATHVPVM